jgi:outer membrane protein TolC
MTRFFRSRPHVGRVSAGWLMAALAFATVAPAQVPSTPVLETAVAPPAQVLGRSYPGSPLSLDAAVEESLASNTALSAATSASHAAALRPDIERYLMPPMAEVQVVQWPINTANPLNAQVMVGAQQEFPGRGKRALRVARGDAEASMAANRVAVETVRIASDVKEAYLQLFTARRLLDFFDEAVGLVRQLGEAAELKYSTGKITQQDVVKALVERIRLEREIVMVAEQARMAEARLNALLGRPTDAAVGALAYPTVGLLPPLDVAQRIASRQQPMLQDPVIESRIADADLKVIASERRPDWVVQGGVMSMPGEWNAVTARVGLTWPSAPWSAKRLAAQRREAEGRREAAQAAARAIATQTAQMVQEAWVRATSAAERGTLIESGLLPRAEHTLELARLGYQADRASFLDVVDTARAVIDIRRDLVQADADRQLAIVALERAMGVGADRARRPAPEVIP